MYVKNSNCLTFPRLLVRDNCIIGKCTSVQDAAKILFNSVGFRRDLYFDYIENIEYTLKDLKKIFLSIELLEE